MTRKPPTEVVPRRSAADDPLALEGQVCFAMVVAARSVVALYRPLLEPMGLTHPQYLVMLALWQNSPLSVKDLSIRLQLDPGTLSPLLKRLEGRHLVVRARDAADERLLSVTLTESGRALRATAELIPGAVVQRLGMSADELEQLHRTLSAFMKAAGAPVNSPLDNSPAPRG
jgi:DNA-binding MarR family transcriptional regulator